MSIDTESGAIRWTPREDQLGEHSVILRVLDPQLATSVQQFTIEVRCNNLAPAIISVPPTQAVVDRVYLDPVRALDDLGDKLAFSLDPSAPPQMSIDAQTGVIRWTPTSSQVGLHSVLVRTVDSAGAAGTQSYTIKVSLGSDRIDPIDPNSPPLSNRPPLIASTPVFNAKIGSVYQYQVVGVDPDGDAITFELSQRPLGMTIGAQTGLIAWTPTADQAGPQTVSIVVRDAKNAVATQGFVVLAKANQPPVIGSTAPTSVMVGGIYRYDVRATDSDNDSLAYRLSSSPSGMTIDELGRIRWPVATDFAGSPTVPGTVIVSDPLGNTATQSFSIAVQPDVTKPVVRLSTSASLVDEQGRFVVDQNAELRLQVQASDNVGIASRSLTLNGVPLALDSTGAATSVLRSPGIVQAVATATDAAGNSSTATVTLRVRDPNDVNAPALSITSPNEASAENIVTYLTNVSGSVSDTNLLRWTLDYALASAVDLNNLPADDPDWHQIATGTTNVTDGLLGVFDPTMLTNDHYVLRLYAEDTGGLINTRGVLVGVQGEAKLGNFRLEFTDLTVPLAGFPITIRRIYDTLTANEEGDFGFGWKLGLMDADIRETVSPDNTFRIGTRVYLTNPDGKRIGFKFDPVPQGSFFGTIWRPRFTADPGVYETLTVPEDGLSQFPDGRYGSFVFGTQYNPSQYTLTTVDGTHYEYNQTAGLQKATDLNGNTLTVTVDAIVHSSGEQIQFLRDGRGRIREIVVEPGTADESSLNYSYSASGDLIEFSDQADLTTTFTYLASPAHYLDEIRDPLGRRASKTIYGPDGRVESVIDALGNEVKQDFDPSNFTGTITDARLNVTHLIYDARGNIVRQQDAEGGVTLYEYTDPHPNNRDKESKVTKLLAGGQQIVTTFNYDARGNTLGITDAVGTKRYEYNARDQVTKFTDELGRITVLSYDAAGNLVEILNALGDTAVIGHDASGRTTSYEDFLGNLTTFVYDPGCSCSQPNEVIYPGGASRQFDYNQLGQQTLVVDERGVATTYEYDGAGRQLREQLAGSAPVAYEYDKHLLKRRIVKRSEIEASHPDLVTEYGYFANDLLEFEVDPEGGVTGYRYDKNGNRTFLARYDSLAAYSNGLGAPTFKHEFAYDKANRLDFEVDDLGFITDFGYDLAGRQTSKLDRNGRVTQFELDARGRILRELWFTTATDIVPVRTITSTYDLVDNLLSIADLDGSMVYTYDVLNRIVTADNAGTSGIPRVLLTSGYDANGNRTSVFDNSGVRVDSTYDNRNQLDQRKWHVTSADQALVDFDYYANGDKRETRRYSDVTATTLVSRSTFGDHDASGRIRDIKHLNVLGQILADYDYACDETGLVKHMAYTGQGGANSFAADYLYDRLGQLTDADYTQGNQPDEFYRYDKNGNRTSARVLGEVRTYQTGRGNQLHSDSDFVYTYDNEGNLRTKTDRETLDVTTYVYDHRNRLTSVERRISGGILLSEVTYRYDAQNRRIAVTENGVTTFTVQDGQNVWADFDAQRQVAARYLLGDRIDEMIARYRPGEGVAWYLTDHLGTVRDVASAGGILVSHFDYDSFGIVVHHQGVTRDDRFSFAGRELDAETSTYYFRARTYDIFRGRFLTQDPLTFDANDFNLYRYVGNQPLTHVDPFGKEATLSYALKVGAIAGAILSPVLYSLCKVSIGQGGDLTLTVIAKKAVVGALFGAAIKGTLFAVGLRVALSSYGVRHALVANAGEFLIAKSQASGLFLAAENIGPSRVLRIESAREKWQLSARPGCVPRAIANRYVRNGLGLPSDARNERSDRPLSAR